MNRLYAALFIMLLSGSTFAQSDGILFNHSDWNSLLQEAGKENKLIFLDAYAEWCGPCKWMAANVFTDPEVGAYMNEHFINAKIDMEKGEGPDLQEKYMVKAYPTYIFVNSKGELVHRFCGSMPKEKFLAKVRNALTEDSTYAFITEKFEKSPKDDPREVLQYVKTLDESCIPTDEALQTVYASIDASPENLVRWSDLIRDYPPVYGSELFAVMLKEQSTLDEENGEKIQTGISQALRKYMFGKLREGKDAYLEAREHLATEPVQDLDKILALSDMYYYKALSDWNNFAKSVDILIEGGRGEDAGFLNSVAWTLYESVDAENKEVLEKGLAWAAKAVELSKEYSILDTYAALLYKTGHTEKAHGMALEAIRTAKKSGEDYSSTEKLMEEYEN